MIDIKEATDEQLKAELDRRDAERLEKKNKENQEFNDKLEHFLHSFSTFKKYRVDNVSEMYDSSWFKGNPETRRIVIDLAKKDDN
jgi:hypothetical protein